MKDLGFDLVFIKWADSHGVSSEWIELSTINEEPDHHYCYTTGWLVVDGKDSVVIAPHICPENKAIDCPLSVCGEMTIPKSAIVD